MDKQLTYKDAGVDTKEGERAVKLMKEHVKATFNENVLADLGGFGGLFRAPVEGLKEPVLVSGTDGVGTKLKIAFDLDKHDTVGIDLVAMCVNDVLCQGATPLFFLDYIATGKVTAEKIADIVSGVAEGCRQSGSALIGGETAEMPGFYGEDEYDMAGFAVGIVDKEDIITGEKIKEGDVIIGLPSSGIHSNGYSLVRKVFEGGMDDDLRRELLTPTKIYAKECAAVKGLKVNGIVHITGGGFYENVPRVLPEGIAASIDMGTWPILPIFMRVQLTGGIETKEMFSTFNMGVGMMMFVDPADAPEALAKIKEAGCDAYVIGRTVSDEDKKVIINE
ncbi:MAG: phosphoribosylformylglycinamidine cyclo-ligase [Clostridia bacterium]|nr:phosphoribosylformylglycinamidine cyclo-ligase [Clostridia bacterium]